MCTLQWSGAHKRRTALVPTTGAHIAGGCAGTVPGGLFPHGAWWNVSWSSHQHNCTAQVWIFLVSLYCCVNSCLPACMSLCVTVCVTVSPSVCKYSCPSFVFPSPPLCLSSPTQLKTWEQQRLTHKFEICNNDKKMWSVLCPRLAKSCVACYFKCVSFRTLKSGIGATIFNF